MIIIDERADLHLSKALEGIKPYPGNHRCLHFHFAAGPRPASYMDAKSIHKHLVEVIELNLPDDETQIYLLHDSDAFVVSPNLTGKITRKLIADVAVRFGMNADSRFSALYQLNTHIGVVQKIIEDKLMDAQIEVESIKKKHQCTLAERKKDKILNPLMLSNEGKSLPARRRNRYKPELMIIEDDVFSLRLVENLLRSSYKLTTMQDAEMALVTYAHVAPDILFLDIGLPDVTGHELLERILKLDPEAYVIMLSGHADRENVTRALEIGAKSFVAKPFTRDKIMQNIDRCPTIKRQVHA